MQISLIAAIDRHGLLGDETGLPWHLPRDLKRFKALTLGKPVVMGRKTFRLIGKPLPGRLNIILTRDPSFAAAGCVKACSLEEALSVAEKHLAAGGADEVMIMGGSRVYAEAIRLWDKLYLTVVEGDFSGTAFFPVDELRRIGGRLVHEENWPADEKNPHPHEFYVIERDRSADLPTPQAGDTRGPNTQALPGMPLDVSAIFPRKLPRS